MNNLIEAQDIKKSFTTEAGELQVLKGATVMLSSGAIKKVIFEISRIPSIFRRLNLGRLSKKSNSMEFISFI